jgi:NADPH2:quinone reductase
MRAITYTQPGDPSVLELGERPIPEPGEGELRIRVARLGRESDRLEVAQRRIPRRTCRTDGPNHDGAGVAGFSVGDPVWVTLAGDGRPAGGTAQEYTAVPAERVFLLPDAAEFELGASVGTFSIARSSLACSPDDPRKMRGLFMRDSRRRTWRKRYALGHARAP